MSKGRRFEHEPKIKKIVKGTETNIPNWWEDESLDTNDRFDILDDLFDENEIRDGQDNTPR